LAASANPERSGFRAQALPARTIAGVILGAAALAAAAWGGWIFAAMLSLVLMTGLWEFLNMARQGGVPVLMGAGLVSGASVLALGFFPGLLEPGLVLVILLLWMIAVSLRPPIQDRLPALALTVFGVLYVVVLGLHLFWLRGRDHGLTSLLLVLLGTWAADTFAFFVGVRFGRRRLAPEISPGKSVEGFFGGILGSILTTVVAVRLLHVDLTAGEAAGVGLVLGAVSPVGDLLESMFKRSFGVKDTSRFIPGHGGVLDRIDSLLLTAPVSYYLLRTLLG
jgi:phosphatidate cytidylyltransferase